MSYGFTFQRLLRVIPGLISVGMICVLIIGATAQPLTNADIIKMSKAGLGDDILITQIENSNNELDDSPDALIALKNAGVTQKVIAAVQKAAQEKRDFVETFGKPSTVGSAPSTVPSPEATPEYVVESNFLTFRIEQCRASGTSIVCDLTIQNDSSQPQDVALYTYQSSAVDESGNEFEARNVQLVGSGGDRAQRRILANVKIKAAAEFHGATSPSATLSNVIVNAGTDIFGLHPRTFPVQFQDVKLSTGKKKPSPTPAKKLGCPR